MLMGCSWVLNKDTKPTEQAGHRLVVSFKKWEFGADWGKQEGLKPTLQHIRF